MRALLQRVSGAGVTVDGEEIGRVGPGLMILLGVSREDDVSVIPTLIQKIIRLRIFDDDAGKMNLSVQDVSGEILVISQFTLYADTKKGNRPSYVNAAGGEEASALYEAFVAELSRVFEGKVACGVFGAEMQVSLVNSGPVTIMLESKP